MFPASDIRVVNTLDWGFTGGPKYAMRNLTEATSVMSIRRHFGTRIRYLRTQRQWTQEQLAERAGLAPKYLGRVERAEVCPSLRVLEQLAVALEMPVHDLLRMPNGAGPSSETLNTQLSARELKEIRSVLAKLQQLFS